MYGLETTHTHWIQADVVFITGPLKHHSGFNQLFIRPSTFPIIVIIDIENERYILTNKQIP